MGGPEEHEGLSPMVRAYSRIQMSLRTTRLQSLPSELVSSLVASPASLISSVLAPPLPYLACILSSSVTYFIMPLTPLDFDLALISGTDLLRSLLPAVDFCAPHVDTVFLLPNIIDGRRCWDQDGRGKLVFSAFCRLLS